MLHENIGMSALIVQGHHTLEKGWRGGDIFSVLPI